MGGMAEVYRAKAGGAGGFEKQLAVKRILPNYSENEEFRRMFEYEARLSSMLTHANIVQIYDFVKHGETYLLAMEYVDGKNLRQFINKVKKLGYQLPVEYGAFLINEVCKGLEYAHKKRDDVTGRPLNIIHRDMSPQNVMLSYDGAVKIVDFGIAKAKDRVDETRSGVIKGKFGYMSPEQANGEPVDHRTDIFSTGIILYELLTGRRLFSADNDMATLKLIQECVVPPPSKFNPKISPELEKIVLKALTKDLNLRFQSAGAFNRQLQEFLGKNYSSFGQKDLFESLSKIFKEEISQEKRRFELLYRQAIPYSQGAQNEGDGDDDGSGAGQPQAKVEEGSITAGDAREKTNVTSSGMSEIADLSPAETPDSGPADKTVVSSSYDLTSNSEPERLGTVAQPDNTKVEHVLEETSISTLGRDMSWNVSEEKKNEKNDRTVVESTNDDIHSVITPTEANTEPRTAQQKPSDKSSSGIALEIGPGRRRENSISALNSVSRNSKEEESFVGNSTSYNGGNKNPRRATTGNESFTFEATTPRRATSRPTPKERDSLFDEEERKSGLVPLMKMVGSMVALGVVVAMTFSFYRSYLNGQVPGFLRGFLPARTTATTPTNTKIPNPNKGTTTVDPEPGTNDSRPSSECFLKVESDPASSTVWIGTSSKGTTPTIIALECGANYNVTIRKDGYEGVSENVFMRKSNQSMFKTLKSIPVGTLVFRVSLNATVTIDEIKFEKYVTLNDLVEVALPAGRRIRVKFSNPVYDVNSAQDVLVQENERLEKTFRLDSVNK